MLSVNNSRKLNTLYTNHVPIVHSSHNKSRVLCWNWYVPTMHHSNSTVRPACHPACLVPMILFMLNSIHDINVGVIIVCACRNNHHPPWLRWYAPQFHNKSKPMELGWGFGAAKCEKRRLIQKSINKGSALNPHHVQSETNCSFNPWACVDRNHLCWNSPDFEDSFEKLKP